MAKKKAIGVFIFDTHLNEDNASVVKSVFEQAFAITKSFGLNRLQHGGDILHSRKAQTQANLTTLGEIYDEAERQGIVIDEIVGNHDKTEYSIADSFIDPYKHHPGVNIIRVSDQRQLAKDIALHYLSFFSDEQYIQYLQAREKGATFLKKNVMLTHIGVHNAVMNNGTAIRSRVTADLFKRYDLTLIGHYHDPQVMEGGTIIYAGASIQHNFGELLGKGLTVLYDDLTRETIPLKYPQYLKYEVDPRELNATDLEEIKKEKLETGDHIRIELVGPAEVVKAFDKSLLEEGGVDVKRKEDSVTIDEIEQRAEPFNTDTIFTEFSDFCVTNTLVEPEGLHYLTPAIQS